MVTLLQNFRMHYAAIACARDHRARSAPDSSPTLANPPLRQTASPSGLIARRTVSDLSFLLSNLTIVGKSEYSKSEGKKW